MLSPEEEKKLKLASKHIFNDMQKDEKLEEVEKIFQNNNLKYENFNTYISRNQSIPKSVKQFKSDRVISVGVTDCVKQTNPFDCGLCTVMNAFMIFRAYLKVPTFINDFKNLQVKKMQ